MLSKIKSVILIDNNDIDVFVNQKILENHGIIDITTFKNGSSALVYLKETQTKYHLILIDIYLPVIDGFEFIEMFNELGLDKIHGEIYLLTASVNPIDKEKANQKQTKYIEKPLTVEKLILA